MTFIFISPRAFLVVKLRSSFSWHTSCPAFSPLVLWETWFLFYPPKKNSTDDFREWYKSPSKLHRRTPLLSLSGVRVLPA